MAIVPLAECCFDMEEAAKCLGTTAQAVRKLIQSDELLGFQGPDRRYFVFGRDLFAYRDKLRARAKAVKP